jgi:hypothetical protein
MVCLRRYERRGIRLRRIDLTFSTLVASSAFMAASWAGLARFVLLVALRDCVRRRGLSGVARVSCTLKAQFLDFDLERLEQRLELCDALGQPRVVGADLLVGGGDIV